MVGSKPDAPGPHLIPYRRPRVAVSESHERARAFRQEMAARRSVRAFSPDPVPRELIEHAIMTAASAPSGAHQQPWTFVAVSDPSVKHRIRLAAEAEERRNYGGRMPPEWLAALAPLGTDWHKPFLDVAPWLVVLFEQAHGWFPDGSVRKHYYARESVGIACGLFIAADPSDGPRHADAYAVADESPGADPRPSEERAAVRAHAGRLPSHRLLGSGPAAQVAR